MRDSGEESDAALLKLLLLLRIHIDRRFGCMDDDDDLLSLLNVMPVVGAVAVRENNKSPPPPSISLSFCLAVEVTFGFLNIIDGDVGLLNCNRMLFIVGVVLNLEKCAAVLLS